MSQEKPARRIAHAAALIVSCCAGAIAATVVYFCWDVATLHDFTLPSAAGKIVTPGGASRGEAQSDWQPPAAYQRDVFVGVQFGSRATIRVNCGRTPRGGWAAGCERANGRRIPLIVVANPCGIAEPYALTLCHELGHAEGWEPWHGGGHFARHAGLYAVRLDGVDDRGRRLEWATTVQAASKSEAGAKARQKANRLIPGFHPSRLVAFNS